MDEVKTKNNKYEYSILENIIAGLLWSAFFYLTVFNMGYNSGRSILFLHFRVIVSEMTFVYVGVTCLLLFLSNVLFRVKRNLFTDICVGLIPAAVTMSVAYCGWNHYAQVFFALMVIFVGIGIYHMVKSRGKNEEVKYQKAYTRALVSLGLLSLITCALLLHYAYIYGQEYYDRHYYEEARAQMPIAKIEGEYPSFKDYIEENKTELQDAKEENLQRLIEQGNTKELEAVLQKLLNYYMAYLGVEEPAIVKVENGFVGDDPASLEGNVIRINESAVKAKKKDDYFGYSIAYYRMFEEGEKYYHIQLANYIDSLTNESNYLFFKYMDKWKRYADSAQTGSDTELIWKGFDHWPSCDDRNVSGAAWSAYEALNGRMPTGD